MIEAEVQIIGGDWAAMLSNPEETALRVIGAVDNRVKAGAPDWGEPYARQTLSLVLSDNPRVQALNRRYRGQDRPTNVLAFPPAPLLQPFAEKSTDDVLYLGDVVLALETVRSEAEAQNKPFANHMSHLIVHGALHLLGYDHDDKRDAARMEAEEVAILDRLGIPDPYMTEEEVEEKEAGTGPDG